jgi:hypothetical protein
VYDDIPTQTCLSNLLASQFRRVIVDLYWDNINRQFNLCPVELPPLAGNATSGYSVDVSALSSITAATSSSANIVPATAAVDQARSLSPRQATGTNSTSTLAGTTSITSTSEAPIPTSTGVSGDTLLELGPFKCSLDLNLGSIMSLYSDYFDKTSNTVSAQLQYLSFNLHAASPFTDPSHSAETPMQGRLPRGGELIGAQFEANLPQALYTPTALLEDRTNLNRSWFRDTDSMTTDTQYFVTSDKNDGVTTTQDGWPGAEWVVLTEHKRLLLNWGDVDPQMEEYDFEGDSGNVFPAGYLNSSREITIDDAGDVVSGCFYQAGDTTVTQVNSSWALATARAEGSTALSHLVRNLTECGFSPILNTTLGGSAVQDSLALYRSFAQSAVFGWAPGEPRNVSKPGQNDEKTQIQYGCAVIDSTGNYSGHWRIDACQHERRAACRIAQEPYAWRLSTMDVPFDGAPVACPDSTVFDLPRTGLENTYLYREILNTTRAAGDDASSILSGVWINFNSLDQENCWVTGGPNATCPYSGISDTEQQRDVLIPTIAALIILILTVLTLLVKCNENRRNSKTRRRGEGGWEYEGVPS